MEQADIEGVAGWLYRVAKLEDDEPAHPLELARQLAIPVLRTDAIRTRAALARVGSEWRIYLRRRLTPRATGWLVAHELAEWALRQEDYRSEDVEHVADAVAAALRAPRRAVQAIGRAPAFLDLAEAFDTSTSSAALRWGEVTGEPIAVVSPGSIRARGEAFMWPDETALRRGRLPGVRRIELGRKRVALIAS